MVRFDVRNGDVLAEGSAAKIAAGLRAPWNHNSYGTLLEFLREERPDVGHVHNWFPLLSPSVYGAFRDLSIPIVQTLHNYRLGCASGTLGRNGKSCLDCLGGDRRPALRHRCYRGSALQTHVWSRTMKRNWSRGVFRSMVDAYVAPSHAVARRHVEMGLPQDRIHVIPHACQDPFESGAREFRRLDASSCGGIFVGRLVPEKGVDVLIRAWEGIEAPLEIVGRGPEEEKLRRLAGNRDNIRFLGELPHDEVIRAIRGAAFMVFPSRWEEPFGLGVIESMACERPVIGSDIGAIPDQVQQGAKGLLVPPGDVAALRRAAGMLIRSDSMCRRLGLHARRCYETRYRPEIHRRRLIELYGSLQSLPVTRAS